MSAPLLSVRGVGKQFGAHRVLQSISFDVHAGEVHVLAGENGAGKSTLIKILAGIHTEYDGELWLRGTKTRFASPLEAARAGVSVIHQELSLIDALSVAENIFLGRERCRARTARQWVNKRTQEEQARWLCRQIGLDIDVRLPVENFSLSTRNRIEIAKALAWEQDATQSRLLVLDEPTSALGAQEAERLFALMKELTARGFGLIYISHKMDEIYRLADRITVLRDGRHVKTATAAELPRDALVREMVGRELSERYPARKTHPSGHKPPVRLSVRGLSAPGVRDVSLDVRAGEILGIGGLQGCGASQLLNALFGADGEPLGQLEVDGQAVRIRRPADAIAQGLALLTSDRKATGLVLSSSIRENIVLASLSKFSRWGWVDRKREKTGVLAHAQALRIRARSIEQEVGTLSGGNQQKVALSKWFETRPRVLCLDEPTRGVDIGAKQEIYQLIRGIASQGAAVLLVSSEMPELIGLSDRIAVMHQGALCAELDALHATQEQVLTAALGLVTSPPEADHQREEILS